MQSVAISRISEDIMNRPHSETVSAYLTRKYSKYGFKREHPIEYNPAFHPEHDKRATYRWIENVSDGLREVGKASDIVRLNHTAWFTDNYQDETIYGIVYQLPARNGKPQYVPAVNDACNENCALVDFSSVTDEKEDAARWADSMAEYQAEASREDQAQEDAKQRLEDIAEEIKTTYADYRKTIRELRANPSVLTVDVVRKMVRAEWKNVKSQIHKLRKQAEKIERDGIDYGY